MGNICQSTGGNNDAKPYRKTIMQTWCAFANSVLLLLSLLHFSSCHTDYHCSRQTSCNMFSVLSRTYYASSGCIQAWVARRHDASYDAKPCRKTIMQTWCVGHVNSFRLSLGNFNSVRLAAHVSGVLFSLVTCRSFHANLELVFATAAATAKPQPLCGAAHLAIPCICGPQLAHLAYPVVVALVTAGTPTLPPQWLHHGAH
jgi:hypothetical protein